MSKRDQAASARAKANKLLAEAHDAQEYADVLEQEATAEEAGATSKASASEEGA